MEENDEGAPAQQQNRGSDNGLLTFPQTLYVCFRFSGSYRLTRSVGWKSYDGQDEATSRAMKTSCGRALDCQTLSPLLIGRDGL